MAPRTPILKLIEEYLSAVAGAVERLRREFGPERLRDGPTSGAFPRRGTLADGSGYQFHGIGCGVECDGIFVDFDFGPDGRYDGFDAWRLATFAEQFPDRYDGLTDLRHIEQALRGLVDAGQVVRSGDPFDSLYYLSEAVAKKL